MPRRSLAAQTAFGPMVIVAIEHSVPEDQRLLSDSLAVRLLPPGTPLIVGACRWQPLRKLFVNLSNRRAPGVWGGVLCRKRYADEVVSAAIDDGIDQVVILGAGLDTRAYRLAAPRGAIAFELDLPENVAYKERHLRQACGVLPEHVVLVPLDFEADDLAVALHTRGFEMQRRAVFVWEAVTQYLTEQAVRRTLAWLAQAAGGSRLVFTYVRRDFLSGTNLFDGQRLYTDFVIKRPIWRFGLHPEDVGSLLLEFGWVEQEQLGRAEYMQRYLEPIGRRLSVTEIERSVRATRA
jgi:methyltransferase (TIGR00027 family)